MGGWGEGEVLGRGTSAVRSIKVAVKSQLYFNETAWPRILITIVLITSTPERGRLSLERRNKNSDSSFYLSFFLFSSFFLSSFLSTTTREKIRNGKRKKERNKEKK